MNGEREDLCDLVYFSFLESLPVLSVATIKSRAKERRRMFYSFMILYAAVKGQFTKSPRVETVWSPLSSRDDSWYAGCGCWGSVWSWPVVGIGALNVY